MEIIKLIALLLGTAVLFISCSVNAPAPTLSYQDKAFRAHISWRINELTLVGFFTSIPSPFDTETDKVITLEITSPSTLEGITLCKKNGTLQTKLGSLSLDSSHAARLFAVSSLFDIDATVTKSTVTEIDGKKLNHIEASSSSGQKYTLFLYPESGLPYRICSEINGQDCVLDILAFEFTHEN